jgi:hypothetical protein
METHTTSAVIGASSRLTHLQLRARPPDRTGPNVPAIRPQRLAVEVRVLPTRKTPSAKLELTCLDLRGPVTKVPLDLASSG